MHYFQARSLCSRTHNIIVHFFVLFLGRTVSSSAPSLPPPPQKKKKKKKIDTYIFVKSEQRRHYDWHCKMKSYALIHFCYLWTQRSATDMLLLCCFITKAFTFIDLCIDNVFQIVPAVNLRLK